MTSRSVLMLCLAACVPVGVASADVVQFYGGNFDGVDGKGSYLAKNTGGTVTDDLRVFDDFNFTGTNAVTKLLGNFLSDIAPSGYDFEVRSGMSNGVGGSLVASGTASSGFTWTTTGRSGFGLTEYQLMADVTNFNLVAGTTYFLNIRPVLVTNTGFQCYLSTTSGAGSVGTPINNGNAFVKNSTLNYNAAATLGYDFSQGVLVVPLPTALAVGLPALVVVGAIARRRRA